MVRARTAHTLASTGPPLIAPEALERQRTAFFEQEAARGAEIRALLVAADPGTGDLIAMAAGGGTKRGKRRATPLTGDVAQGTAEPDAKRALYNIGDCALAHAGEDSWGIIGQSIRLHKSFWGLDDGEYSDARVVAYAGAHTFTAGNLSKHTYVVECEGHYYPATHDTVAAALTDASVKRRVRKAGPPRLL
jgi:hypothetical protein